jgi:uncharacterized LabA/DUF88 family protein
MFRMDHYLFVDGGYFREIIKRTEEGIWGNNSKLTLDYERIGTKYRKCFYYDCIGRQFKDESQTDYDLRREARRAEFSLIQRTDKWHVTEGVLTGSGERARQKQVDIRIAVDMLSHAYRRNAREIDFIAGDQDFKPLVEALVRDGVFVRIMYDRTSASKELLDVADARTELTVYDYLNWKPDRSPPMQPVIPTRGAIDTPPTGAETVGKMPGYGEVKCARGKSGFTVFYSSGAYPGNLRYWHHPDNLDFLKRVISFFHPKIEWL